METKMLKLKPMLVLFVLSVVVLASSAVAMPLRLSHAQNPTPTPNQNSETPFTLKGLKEIRLGVTSNEESRALLAVQNFILSPTMTHEYGYRGYGAKIWDSINEIGDPTMPDSFIGVSLADDMVNALGLTFQNDGAPQVAYMWQNADPKRLIAKYGPPSRIYTDVLLQARGHVFGLGLYWKNQNLSVGYRGGSSISLNGLLLFCLDLNYVGSVKMVHGLPTYEIRPEFNNAEYKDNIQKQDGTINNASTHEEAAAKLLAGECLTGWASAYSQDPGPEALATLVAGYTLTPTATLVPTNTPTATFTFTPTATATSTPTPTFTPSPTATLVIPPSFAKLKLTSMCSADPALTRRWRVRNSNAFPLPFTWEIYGNGQAGSGVAVANGDVFFESNTVNGANTLRLFVGGRIQEVKASGGARCP
jgi:hypothetical protein